MSRMFYPRTSVLILIISSTVRLVNILQFTVFDQTNNFVWKLSGKLMVKTKFKIPNSSTKPHSLFFNQSIFCGKTTDLAPALSPFVTFHYRHNRLIWPFPWLSRCCGCHIRTPWGGIEPWTFILHENTSSTKIFRANNFHTEYPHENLSFTKFRADTVNPSCDLIWKLRFTIRFLY